MASTVMNRAWLALGASALALTWAASASAQATTTAGVQAAPPLQPPAGAAAPDSAVAEVVVTAQKRSENLQNVPLTVTVAGAQLLQDANVRDIKDLQVLVPGLTVVSSQNELVTQARIRGIGTVGSNIGLESSVGIQVDGVYRPRNGVSFGDIGELSQVEVLKGPQGTLFGKNTDAGLINIVTAEPSYKFGAAAEFTAGNYGEVGGSASVTGPLIADKLAGSLFFAQRSRDGFYDVSTGAGPRTQTTDQDQNFYTLRGQLAADPIEGLHARLIADYTRRSENCCAGVQYIDGPLAPLLQSLGVPGGAVLNPANPFQRESFANRSTGQSVRDAGISLQLDYRIPQLDGAKITSITAYRDYIFRNGEDSDFTAADLLYRPYNGDSGSGFKQFSQELRLGGTYGALDYDIGGFYANELLNSRVSELFGSDFPNYLGYLISGGSAAVRPLVQPLANFDSNGLGQKDDYNQNDRTFSFFTQETYHVTRQLELTGGVRFTQDHKDLQASYSNSDGGRSCLGALGLFNAVGGGRTATGQGVAGIVNTVCNPLFNPLFDGVNNRQSRTENEVTGTAKIGYHFTSDYFGYASYSRGYKAGGYNLDRIAFPFSAAGLPGATPTSIAQSLQPALNTEFPGEFVNSYEIGLKSTLLHRKLDLNAAVFYQDYTGFQLNAYNGLFYTVVSVPKVESLGAEFDLLYRPTHDLTIQGGLTYANSRFPRSDASVLGSPDNALFAATNLLPGQRLPEAPLYSVSASATYEHPIYGDLVGRANVDVKYESSVNTGTTGDPVTVQSQFALVNARLGIGPANHRWSLEIYADNLFDRNYSQGIFASPFQSVSAVNSPQTTSYTDFLGEPRTFGGTVRVKY